MITGSHHTYFIGILCCVVFLGTKYVKRSHKGSQNMHISRREISLWCTLWCGIFV